MMTNTPSVSIIIPTHNRRASLKRLLDSLQKQTYPSEDLEVIVVADGCSDNTIEMLRDYATSFPLRFMEQFRKGAGGARNKGAEMAKGRLLLFLDDDVEAFPDLVEGHVRAHRQADQVVIGYLPPLLKNKSTLFHVQLRVWWEEKFQGMHQLGHRFTFEDLLSGNFSLPTGLFRRVGGFDAAFRYREDYELGLRLIKAGAHFILAMNAAGFHRDEATDLDRSLLRKRYEGVYDVLFGRRHPEVMHALRLFSLGKSNSALARFTFFMIFRFPGLWDILVARLRQLLDFAEDLRLHHAWQRGQQKLHACWYLRGVVDELNTRRALANYLQGGSVRPSEPLQEIEVDIQQGLAKAEQKLDATRPMSVRIHYGGRPVGRIPPQAGAEPLRGIHLRSILATTLSWPLLQALSWEGAIHPAIFRERLSGK